MIDKSRFSGKKVLPSSEYLPFVSIDPLLYLAAPRKVSEDELCQLVFLAYGFWLGLVNGEPRHEIRRMKESDIWSWLFLAGEPGAGCYP